MYVSTQSVNKYRQLFNQRLWCACGIGRFLRVPIFFLEKTNMSSATVFVLLWRGLSYFKTLFSCLLLDQKLSFLTFSIFVTLKHTVVSHVHSNTHIHAAVSMRTLFVQRLDQSGKQVTSGDSESIKTLFQLQLLTVNELWTAQSTNLINILRE